MTSLYALTVFLGAWLLFSIQPMIGRALLPYLGGAPVVWNTCLVFFQALLLFGYAYARWLSRTLAVRRQGVVHLAVTALPMALLAIAASTHGSPLAIWPVAQSWLAPEASPVLGMIGVLTLTVGLPCLVLAACSPLLQRWYSEGGARGAEDPYFLYAASNLGSLIALVSYPLFLERYLTRMQQGWIWSVAFALFAGLSCSCAAVASRRSRLADEGGEVFPAGKVSRSKSAKTRVTYSRRWWWMALSAAPSSLLLGVTSYITTDIAAAPLLWVIPLVLYLLTFVIAFGRRRVLSHGIVMRYLPLALVVWSVTIVLGATEPASILIGIHLAAFFWTALACHGALHRDRPPAEELTGYYLMVAIGGVVGGGFNAFLAPNLFDGLFEYPLAMVAAFAVVRGFERSGENADDALENPRRHRSIGLAVDIAIPFVAIALVAFGSVVLDGLGVTAERALSEPTARYMRGTVCTLPLLWCFAWSARTVSFVLGVASVLLVVPMVSGVYGGVLHVERTWFGVHRVTVDAAGEFHVLIHGSTVHGRQRWSPEPSTVPGSYYHEDGPVGDVFRHLNDADAARPWRIAVVGLGAGSLACYGRNRPEQHWTFYEIDPAVVRIASNPRYFTFLRDSFPDQSRLQIIVGDARLELERAADGRCDVIILDAFSSDSVPVHLLTSEAVDLYLEKLSRGGLLLFHVSNRHLELGSLLASLAAARDEPLRVYGRDDTTTPYTLEQRRDGKQASIWVVMASETTDVDWLPDTWTPLAVNPKIAAWTDEYASILAVAKRSFWSSE